MLRASRCSQTNRLTADLCGNLGQQGFALTKQSGDTLNNRLPIIQQASTNRFTKLEAGTQLVGRRRACVRASDHLLVKSRPRLISQHSFLQASGLLYVAAGAATDERASVVAAAAAAAAKPVYRPWPPPRKELLPDQCQAWMYHMVQHNSGIPLWQPPLGRPAAPGPADPRFELAVLERTKRCDHVWSFHSCRRAMREALGEDGYEALLRPDPPHEVLEEARMAFAELAPSFRRRAMGGLTLPQLAYYHVVERGERGVVTVLVLVRRACASMMGKA